MKIEQNGKYKFLMCSQSNLAQGVINTEDSSEIVSPFVKYCVDAINSLETGSRVLLLGGGTFCIPRNSKETVHMDIVEIDPEMYETAKEHFSYKDKLTHQIYFADAKKIVPHFEDIGNKYDLIIVDLFDGYEVPTFARTFNFLTMLMIMSDRVIINEISANDTAPYFEYPLHTTTKGIYNGGNIYWVTRELNSI